MLSAALKEHHAQQAHVKRDLGLYNSSYTHVAYLFVSLYCGVFDARRSRVRAKASRGKRSGEDCCRRARGLAQCRVLCTFFFSNVMFSVAEVFATQRQLEGEVKQLHAGLSMVHGSHVLTPGRFSKTSLQWISMVDNFNTALKVCILCVTF